MALTALVLTAAALAASGCASAVSIAKWRPDDGDGVLSVRLVAGQTGPGEMQVRQANSTMKRLCGDRTPHVVEEGTSISKEMMIGIYGGGTYDAGTFYWIVKCDPTPSASASTTSPPAP